MQHGTPAYDASPLPRLIHQPPAWATKVVCEVIAGSRRGMRFEFDHHDTLIVGRSRTAHLLISDDPHFSRHHFLLEVNPPAGYVRDLGSRNGTLLNGKPVKESPLVHGDVVSAGQTQIRFSVVPLDETSTGVWDTNAASPLRSGSQPQVVSDVAPVASMVMPPAALTPKSARLPKVPGYEILNKLGQGGMGVVYLARRQSSGQTVAVKVILPESAAHEESMQRFLREVSVLSRLKHPRIVQFHELGMAHGQFFFAMEYVEPADLNAHLQGRTAASRIKTLCGIICQTLEGLRYAHGESFVHRDIKPSNILVTRIDRRLRTKLADFGLAKNMENAGFSGMTHAGQAVGTIAFMAPEQITQGREARPTMDIYAAGGTLYYLLAGRLPYEFPVERDPLTVILEDEPVPLTRCCPEIPAALAAVVHRALAKDAAQRFQTAEAMWQALAPFATGRS